MKVFNGKLLYKIGDVAALCGCTSQTISIWYSAKEHCNLSLPAPIVINGKRWWTELDAKRISEFAKTMRRGKIAKYNRIRMGARGAEAEQRRLERKQKKEQIEELRRERERDILSKSMVVNQPGGIDGAMQDRNRWQAYIKSQK